MAVTVLQRKASTQQINFLLVPAIKGAVYINTHSQPALTKLDNENIGGHRYTFKDINNGVIDISVLFRLCGVVV